jgi:iron complex outermembrane receptor protein
MIMPFHCPRGLLAILVPLFSALSLFTTPAHAQTPVSKPATPERQEEAQTRQHTDPSSAPESAAHELPAVIVTDTAISGAMNAYSLPRSKLRERRSANSDTARLLENAPGVFSYAAGGISSLPVVRGLADDRLRTSVDGMDLMSACPNHMNPALSYIAPSKVAAITVYAGIAPVSEGGDSIGGAIKVESATPRFAAPDGGILAEGEVGYFSRSNGHARGAHLEASIANTWLNLSYSDSWSESDNYRAARGFKKPGMWKNMGAHPIRDDEVASSAYGGARNRDAGIALSLSRDHLLRFQYGEQYLDYENFPNQRMDMLASRPDADPLNAGGYVIDKDKPSNINRTLNLKYAGRYEWGSLEAGVFRQTLRHHMEMNPERFMAMLMPMDAQATTVGGTLKLGIPVASNHLLNVGGDFQDYRLDDWWPPIGISPGSMCCDDFWNIRDGRRKRVGVFAELETQWNPAWQTLLGIRGGLVESDVGGIQGYSDRYANDANRFNQLDHDKTDRHFDFTVLARFTPDSRQDYEFGLARKTRSPSLYERYPWSTNAMAAVMNNVVGDGNGYIGNIRLEPEIAHTLGVSGAWHDAEKARWEFKISGHITYVKDYIDARRCPATLGGVCASLPNGTATDRHVLLQYVNQDALLYGIDITGHTWLGEATPIGGFSIQGALGYLRGKNLGTGDSLYHIMPANAKLALRHRLAGWINTLEMVSVSAKKRVSRVRNEMPTPGYTLFNLSTAYAWKHFGVELAVENLFNKFYYQPLGGAYLGQGNSMALNAIPHGMVVPGRGRSVNVALNARF